jgi:hypothetical protein
MKKNPIILLLMLLSMAVYAQYELPVYFEEAESDTLWTQFANAGDAPENFDLVANPDQSGINPSDSCIQFIVMENADPWVGAYSDYFGDIEITDDNYILQMMVYKNVISNCYLKLELGADVFEVIVPNTEIEVWELLSFDFSEKIGNTYTRLVFFPDFPSTRTEGSLCYIDNIGFEGTFDFESSVKKTNNSYIKIYPNPAQETISLQGTGLKRAVITNIVGQEIRTLQFSSSDHQEVNISDLGSGIYFLTVETSKGTSSYKFSKN